MKELKMNKGITLIALIITIIVLLILAVVAIGAVQGDGIIEYAKNAKTEYQATQDNEIAALEGYLTYLNTATGTTGETQKELPAIGDKVAYNEGYSASKTSTVDSAFTMDDLEWRVLDVEADGTVELISTKPTTSTLTLSGEDGWLNAETNLDTLCSELYANGTGVTARSLKVEDVDKLAGVLTDADRKVLNSDYGSLWRYKYDTTSAKIQYSKSTDNGNTWTDYADAKYATFKEPGEAVINSTNYQDSYGNPIVSKQKFTYYGYKVSSKITSTTSDGISIASLITKGLNDTNDAASGSNVTQWLASRCVKCYSDSTYAHFNVRRMGSGYVNDNDLWYGHGASLSPACAVRPVVTIPVSATLTKVDGVWQVIL